MIHGYVEEYRHIKLRKFILKLVPLTIIIGFALSTWKTLQIVLLTEYPLLHDPLNPMKPTLQKGDILLLTHFNTSFKVGDIVIFKVREKEILIVRRVLQVQQKGDDPLDQLILTKGDNYEINDRGLYPEQQMWLERSDILGQIQGIFPFVGYIIMLLSDKTILILTLIILVYDQLD